MEDTSESSSASSDGTESLYRSTRSASEERIGPGTRAGRIGRSLAAYASGAPFVAAVAAVETLIAIVLLGVPLSPAPVVVALVAFAVYTIDHVADADADTRSTPTRAILAYRYGDQLMVAAALAYGIAVALSVLGGPFALVITLLPGVFWVLYASDWLPTLGGVTAEAAGEPPLGGREDGFRYRLPRVKDVLVLNSLLVAFGWAVAVTVIPVAFASGNGGSIATVGTGGTAGVASGAVAGGAPLVAVVFGYFLLRSFVDTELPNVRDVEADATVGVATLPVVYGVVSTRRALYAVDVATAALVTAAAVTGLVAVPVAGALLVGVGVSIGVTALAGRIDDPAVLGVAPDCSYFLVGALLVGVRMAG